MIESPLHRETVVPGLRDLFLGFTSLAMTSFGGAGAWARRFFVEQRRWLTPDQFTNMLSLCQFMPGPNVGNMAVVLGARSRGWLGSVAGLLGFFTAPFMVYLALGELQARTASVASVRGALVGVGAAAAGMMVAQAIQLVVPVARRRPLNTTPFILATFAAVGLANVPLPVALLVVTPVSLAVAWFRR